MNQLRKSCLRNSGWTKAGKVLRIAEIYCKIRWIGNWFVQHEDNSAYWLPAGFDPE